MKITIKVRPCLLGWSVHIVDGHNMPYWAPGLYETFSGVLTLLLMFPEPFSLEVLPS